MFKRFFILFLCSPLFLFAQYSIKGKIDNGENFSWLLLYKIKDGKEIYLDNAKVENNEFEFTLSEDTSPGIYRIFYQVENQLFIEFIYNREDIELSFNPNSPHNSVKFTHSDDNLLYQDYSKSIGEKQQNLDSLQVAYFNSSNTDIDDEIINAYKINLIEFQAVQHEFENRSKDMLANHIIKASKQFNAELPIKSPTDYLTGVKTHFFDAIDFNDAILINSTFINDKIYDFVFYLNQSNDEIMLNKMQKQSIDYGLNKLDNSNLKKNIEEELLNQYAEDQNIEMVNFMLENHYNKLPSTMQDSAFKKHMLSEVKTAVGSKSPDIEWKEMGIQKSLYSSNASNIYIIVFFSTGCPHCRDEIPEFYKFIETTSNIKVIAIGLEDEKTDWENMIKKFPNFTHILDLDKWDSKRVEAFGISAIPNYFILNKDKTIIAKPEDFEEMKSYFE